MPKVTAYQIMFEGKPSPGVNLFGSEAVVKEQIARSTKQLPSKKWSWHKTKVDDSEHMVSKLEPIRVYKPPPPGSDIHYKKGVSCPKQGKEHKYILSQSGTYEKCVVCGSCRSLRGGQPRSSKSASKQGMVSDKTARLQDIDRQIHSLISKKQQLETGIVLNPKRQLLQPKDTGKPIAIPRWASAELPRGHKRERFNTLLATDNIAVLSDKKRKKTVIIRRRPNGRMAR